MMGRAARWSLLGVLLGASGLGACSFDGGGVPGSDGTGPDGDADGVPDASDNCPAIGNPDQDNEDGDGLGNACDNCPAVDNDDQANSGEADAAAEPDSAGDACDPDPSGPGNDILFFEGFDDPSVLADWRVFGGGTWSVSGGALQQGSTGSVHTLYFVAEQFSGGVIDTRFTADSIPGPGSPTDVERGFGSMLAFATGPDRGAGYHCALSEDPGTEGSGAINILTYRGSQAVQNEVGANLNTDLVIGGTYDLRQGLDATADEVTCAADSTDLPAPFTLEASDSTYAAGFAAIRTAFVGVHVDYVVVYAVP